jgi:hypothetical protein
MNISLWEGNDNTGLIEKVGDFMTYIAQDDTVVRVGLQMKPEINGKGERTFGKLFEQYDWRGVF